MDDMVINERRRSLKVAWYWKVMIGCIALTLGLATVILIPPIPNISLGFAKEDLAIGLVVTNSAAAAIHYRDITATAFVAGQPFSEVSFLMPFRQSAGEVSRVWFRLRRNSWSTEGYTVVMTARAAYGGVVWPPWKEIEVTAVCESESEERKCEVDGVWIWRERLLFVAVFVLPFLVYAVIAFVFSEQQH